MGRRAGDGRTGLSVRLVLAGAVFLAAGACDDASSGLGQDGVILATGPTASWNLLSVPQEGGQARLLSFIGGEDSARVLWRGSSSLPPSDRAHRVGSRHLALLRSDGQVFRYDPTRDLLSEVGRSASADEWTAHGDWGLLRDGESGALLQVAAGGAWTYPTEPAAVWAAPADGGSVVALLARAEGGDADLLRYDGGGEEPAARLSGAFVPPAVVTGFGRQVALAGRSDEGWELVLVSLSELEPVARTALPGKPDALAASPSSHELYVTMGTRLQVLGRPSMDQREERSLPGAVRELRPGLLGGPLLARTAEGVFLLPWDDDGTRSVESEWRPDLPLSLPDGTVLVARDGGVYRVRPGAGEGEMELGPADRWWIPVRWALPARRPAQPLAGSTGQEGSRVEEAPDTAAPDTAEAAGGEEDVPTTGFYAVVVAARNRDGVERLLGTLEADGWPTALQEWRDDAGRTWYRGLVGPYETRPGAEDAARRLQREEDLSVWVKELGPGIDGGT